MKADQDALPQKTWLNRTFKFFGTLFVSFLGVLVARFISYNLPSLDAIYFGTWLIVLWEFLAVLLIFWLIVQLWSRTKKPYAIGLSLSLSVFAITSIAVVDNIIAKNKFLEYFSDELLMTIDKLEEKNVEYANVIKELDPAYYFAPPVMESVSHDELISSSAEAKGEGANSLLFYITAISGLFTAVTGFYSQVITAKKVKAELELQKMKMEFEYKQEKTQAKGRRNLHQKSSKSKKK